MFSAWERKTKISCLTKEIINFKMLRNTGLVERTMGFGTRKILVEITAVLAISFVALELVSIM